MKYLEIDVTVNGKRYHKLVASNCSLLRFLREELFLNSVKEGCDEGECGACTVIVDGHPVNSCLVLAAEVNGKEVLTTEGLSTDERLHPLQEAFIECGAIQCGFCTPGMLMSAIACLNLHPHPTREQINKEMEGNICRCTGYQRIADAILYAVEKMDRIREDAKKEGLDAPSFPGIDDRFNEKRDAGYQVS